jgi:hypothetical protein
MGFLFACSCGLDPASESMLVQSGVALAISAPFWFREQIAAAVRRLRGLPPEVDREPCTDASEDRPASD